MTSETLAAFWRSYDELRQRRLRLLLVGWAVILAGGILLSSLPGLAVPVAIVAGPILFSFYLVLTFQWG